jgi:two-component system cell cycle response regulator DivK
MTTPKATILLAEDTEDVRSVVKQLLETRGYHVVEAKHGEEALELAPRHKPDVILMDLNMPVLDGWEATRLLRQMPEVHSTPVIGLSAQCDGGWYNGAIAAGLDDCIQKPFDLQVLDEVLSRFLQS